MSRFEGTDRYIATADLKVAVNAAVALERPLLIKGEPGTGKTVLAYEVAKAFDAPLITWHVKSTTKAHNGLYEYDAVSRLRDSQLGEARVQDVRNYLKKGKLWEAFTSPTRPVLLIDEIDKADIEFPNDLLQELDRMEFYVQEIDETIRAEVRPIVIITSNRTREVHDALKRRCLYHWVDYPDYQKELQIITARIPGAPRKLAEQVTAFIQEMRETELFKIPGISETLDWLSALLALNQTELDPSVIDDTLGMMLKYQDDIETVKGEPVRAMLERSKNRGPRRGGRRRG